MSVVTTTALILRHRDDRERDRFVVALTPAHGLLNVRARGTKRSTSKLAGSLEPLTEVELSWADGRAIGLVTGAVIKQRWPALHHDLIASLCGQWLAELVEHLAKPGQHTSELYDLTRTLLHDLNNQHEWTLGRRWLSLDRAAYQCLALEGFVPALDHCPRCNRPMPATTIAYDPLVGFLHDDEAPTTAARLDHGAITFLQTGAAPGPERTLFRQIHPVVESIINHAIDRPLRAERVLRAVFRQARLSTGERYGMMGESHAKTTK